MHVLRARIVLSDSVLGYLGVGGADGPRRVYVCICKVLLLKPLQDRPETFNAGEEDSGL